MPVNDSPGKPGSAADVGLLTVFDRRTLWLRPAASAVRVSADKLLVHQALAEHCGARSELGTAARLARAAKRVGQ